MKYQCPSCKTELEWDNTNTHRPFCSERCKNYDLVAWANEDNKFPGSPEWEDILSSDIEAELNKPQR